MLKVAYFAGFLAVLLLIAAGQSWWRIGLEGRGSKPNERPPVLSAHRVRIAATATALAFWLLAVAVAAVLLDRL